jgi:hypothetical protein
MNTDINAVWSKALAAVKSAEKAKTKVNAILVSLRDEHGVTRKDALPVMKKWLESGVFGRTQMFSYLNEVWPTPESEKKGGRQADPELSEMAEELLSLAVESYGEKARSVLLAAWKLSGKSE